MKILRVKEKPPIYEAMQLLSSTTEEDVRDFIYIDFYSICDIRIRGDVTNSIHTVNGQKIYRGDWLVKGMEKDKIIGFCVYSNDEFNEKFELIENNNLEEIKNE